MTVYYVAFCIVLVLSVLSSAKRIDNKTCVWITGILFFLIAALRNRIIGNDTDIYVRAFEKLAGQPIVTAATYSNKEFLFWIFLSQLGRFTTNYTVLFAIVAFAFTISVWHFIFKYSEKPCLSVIVLLAFNMYQFSLTGMRQTIAMSFAIWAFDMLIEHKYIKSSLLIAVASLFHKSALVCLIAVAVIIGKDLLNVIITRRQILVIQAINALAFIFRNKVAGIVSFLISDRGYEVEMRNQGITMTLVVFLTVTLIAVIIPEEAFEERNFSASYIIATIACFFQMLVPAQSIFFRVAFYFLIIYVSVIPNGISRINNPNNRKIVYPVMYIGLSVQYLLFTSGSSGIVPYLFFWA